MNSVATGLRGNTTLKSLRVDANNIGDMGIEQLAVVLAQPSAVLATLSLASNHIGDDGASTFAAMLAKNSSLLRCNLDGKDRPLPQHARTVGHDSYCICSQ
jgi:Ran GTPase-activating protein (RanGAP) involved in mRNA processing and transport